MRDGIPTSERRYGDSDVTYVITLQLKPGRAGEFRALVDPVLDAMRREAGFINAALHRDPGDPDRFLLYETWRDHDEVVAVEVKRPYRQTYWERLPDLLARPREVQVWRPLRGDFGVEARAARYGVGAVSSTTAGPSNARSATTGR